MCNTDFGNVQEEMNLWKSKCMKMEEKIMDLENKLGRKFPSKAISAEVENDNRNDSPHLTDNIYIASHIEQLNNTVGNLRKEKVELTMTLRKQQSCSVQLEGLMDHLTKQVSGNLNDRHQTDVCLSV